MSTIKITRKDLGDKVFGKDKWNKKTISTPIRFLMKNLGLYIRDAIEEHGNNDSFYGLYHTAPGEVLVEFKAGIDIEINILEGKNNFYKEIVKDKICDLLK